jgi:hypothetical protein
MILGSKPFEEPFTLKMEYFNEVMIVAVMYCMMTFSDAVPQVESQFLFGYACCLLVLVHLMINLFFILSGTLKHLKRHIKKCSKKQKQRKLYKKKVKPLTHRVSELVQPSEVAGVAAQQER